MIKAVYTAKYVLAEPTVLLQNAAIHVSDTGRISRIETWKGPTDNPAAGLTDWGSAVLTPGFVNAHAHLELTSFHNRVTQFATFTDWISQLIDRRRRWTQDRFLRSAKEGAKLCLASGTTMVGDITSSGVGWEATRSERLRRVVFEEVIALSPGQANPAVSQLKLLFEQADSNPLLIHGVSPHAPYSVSPKLYRRLAKLAQSEGKLLATHVAETRAEIEFLRTGAGEFRDFLFRIGVLPTDWKPPRLSPVIYLDSLGVLGRSCLLIHCNYLDQESIKRIAKTNCTVVYCPRSHAFFGHEKHPVRQLLDRHINVALGTDSLASNSSLSMIDEMRFLFKTRKDLKPEEIFRAATLNGAAALNCGGSLGRLRRSYWADMAVFKLPPNLGSRKLLDQILEGAGECIATIVGGRIAWQKSSS
jgi:cytosine/adenosine deaminase-related metal-dependent hydrolase